MYKYGSNFNNVCPRYGRCFLAPGDIFTSCTNCAVVSNMNNLFESHVIMVIVNHFYPSGNFLWEGENSV